MSFGNRSGHLPGDYLNPFDEVSPNIINAKGNSNNNQNNNNNAASDEQQWACPVCTYGNHGALNFCEMCEAARPAKPAQPQPQPVPQAPFFVPPSYQQPVMVPPHPQSAFVGFAPQQAPNIPPGHMPYMPVGNPNPYMPQNANVFPIIPSSANYNSQPLGYYPPGQLGGSPIGNGYDDGREQLSGSATFPSAYSSRSQPLIREPDRAPPLLSAAYPPSASGFQPPVLAHSALNQPSVSEVPQQVSRPFPPISSNPFDPSLLYNSAPIDSLSNNVAAFESDGKAPAVPRRIGSGDSVSASNAVGGSGIVLTVPPSNASSGLSIRAASPVSSPPSGAAAIASHPLRDQRRLLAIVAQEGGSEMCLQGVENWVKKALHLQGLNLPADWLLRVDEKLIRDGARASRAAARLFYELVALHVKDDKALQAENCSLCGRSGSDIALQPTEVCDHLLCLPCVRKTLLSALADNCKRDKGSCPVNGCKKELPVTLIQQCLSGEEFERYSTACVMAAVSEDSTLVKCPNESCGAVMELMHNSANSHNGWMIEKDEAGKPLTPEALMHFNKYRVRCRVCNKDFCSECKRTPYHKGFTCDQLEEYNTSKHCRYCKQQLKAGNTVANPSCPALADVCTEADCRTRSTESCTRMLECGHPCGGYLNEKHHLPCLHESCVKTEAKLNQSGEDYCNICYVESLDSAPAIQLECGHIYHKQCVQNKISKGWPGTRITFGHLQCPLCKKDMRHPELDSMLDPVLKLRAWIKEKALIRLKIENMEKDDKLIREDSKFYNQPAEYAMASFAYYNCFKCKKPYFGGRRDCEQNADADNRPPEEFICFDCCDLHHVTCNKSDHKEYHVWKCRFCCSQAVWFCWGTTHFCDSCHSNQPWARAKWSRDKFTQCKGKEDCKLRIDHPPNGSETECEFSLGCGMCIADLRKKEEEAKKEEDALHPENKPKPAPAPPSRKKTFFGISLQ